MDKIILYLDDPLDDIYKYYMDYPLDDHWSLIAGGQVAKLTGKVWGRVIQASQSSLASIEMVRNDNPATGHQEMVLEWGLNGGKWWF